MVYTELDVFKICLGNKSTIQKLSKDILKCEDYKSKQSLKEWLKLYYKVWSGLTKFIRSQCSQNRWVHFSLVGSFSSVSNLENNKDESKQNVYWFIPDVSFLDKGNYKFQEDQCNKNPYSEIKIAKVNVSPSSIANVCSTTPEAVSYILKDIVSKSIKLSKEGKSVRLALKIGYLNLYQGKVLFDTLLETNNDYSTASLNKLIGRRAHKSYGGGTKFSNVFISEKSAM